MIGLGWLVALCCAAYLGLIGISLTGTSVGPLPSLPSVTSKTVVFGSEVAGLPKGALEVPFAAPAPQAAAGPATVRSFASSVGMGGASR